MPSPSFSSCWNELGCLLPSILAVLSLCCAPGCQTARRLGFSPDEANTRVSTASKVGLNLPKRLGKLVAVWRTWIGAERGHQAAPLMWAANMHLDKHVSGTLAVPAFQMPGVLKGVYFLHGVPACRSAVVSFLYSRCKTRSISAEKYGPPSLFLRKQESISCR